MARGMIGCTGGLNPAKKSHCTAVTCHHRLIGWGSWRWLAISKHSRLLETTSIRGWDIKGRVDFGE